MTVHVQVWSGAGSAKIIDMTNAGKRGKVCRIFSFRRDSPEAIDYLCTTPEERSARSGCYALECKPLREVRPDDYDSLVLTLRGMIRPGTSVSEDTIKGIHAPVPLLTAGNDAFFAEADENGLHLGDRTDQHNDPREITPHDQSKAEAYRRASKVWWKLKSAKTMHEASEILSAAGCRLHYYIAQWTNKGPDGPLVLRDTRRRDSRRKGN